jgi:MFS family permease
MVGGAVGGRLVNRYGRKSIAVTTVFISGICCILFTFIPVIGLSVAVWFIAASTVGMTWAGLPSLTMEQVPDFRASMMSINNSFDNAGTILGVIIGGLILNLFSNFHLLMLILGALGASAAAVLLFGAKDPCKVVSTQ